MLNRPWDAARELLLVASFMTLRLYLEERHQWHTNEGTSHYKPKGRSVLLEGIKGLVPGGSSILGDTPENCCADPEANRDRESWDVG